MIISMPTLKPYHSEAVHDEGGQTGAILSLERHNVIGGLDSAAFEVIAIAHFELVKRLGILENNMESNSHKDLLNRYDLSAKSIFNAAEKTTRTRMT